MGRPGVPEIANRLGWLTISEPMLEHAADLRAFAAQCRAEGFDRRACCCGMGGSSLGARGHPPHLRRHRGRPAPARARLHRPGRGARRRAARRPRQRRCSSSPRSRAGRSRRSRTSATSSQAPRRSASEAGQHFVAVTDPGSPLVSWPRATGSAACSRTTRTSAGATRVLSYFGLVPAALMGVDVEALLHRAQVAEQHCTELRPGTSNSGLWLGREWASWRRRAATRSRSSSSEPIASFGLWVEQLIAESHRQAGQGHPAGGRRAARRAGRLRQRPRVRLPAQRRRARRGARRAGRRAGRGRAAGR